VQSKSIIKAGRDFINGSFIFKWTPIAPTIRHPIKNEDGSIKNGNQIPANKRQANNNFEKPTTLMKLSLNPYALNSDSMLLASPPLYDEGFVLLIIHTLNIPKAIIT
jgi:hypothetical protein